MTDEQSKAIYHLKAVLLKPMLSGTTVRGPTGIISGDADNIDSETVFSDVLSMTFDWWYHCRMNARVCGLFDAVHS